MIETTCYIPRHNFYKWYACFKTSQGRLLSNPIDGDKVYVRYAFECVHANNRFELLYHKLTTPIVEKVRQYNVFFKIKVAVKRVASQLLKEN